MNFSKVKLDVPVGFTPRAVTVTITTAEELEALTKAAYSLLGMEISSSNNNYISSKEGDILCCLLSGIYKNVNG